MKQILICIICVTLYPNAQALEFSDFKEVDSKISKLIVNDIVKTHKLDVSSCKPEHFTKAKYKEYTAVYSSEDECDGGNSFGIVFKGLKKTHLIIDSDIEEVK